MHLYHNIKNDLVINVEQIHHKKQIIQKLKHRFRTFGYREIETPAFEPYDLYIQMNGTVNKHEMIKTIDNTGNVLVLRPDITIPITKQLAVHNHYIRQDQRYFYFLDVFRQTQSLKDRLAQNQAGVEYFGNPSPEADAEIIALAVQLLKDIKLKDIKIELGHAGLFGQIVQELQLEKNELIELKRFIQAKNVPEIERLLSRMKINSAMAKIVSSLPFLYGPRHEVIASARQLPLTEKMVQTLGTLNEICHCLEAYQLHHHIAIDLGLINHMGYYSDMIFQGFTKDIGKPVLMGGRYNALAGQFGADIPAIGFACDVDTLTAIAGHHAVAPMEPIDLLCLYDSQSADPILNMAQHLRMQAIKVVAYPKETVKDRIPASRFVMEWQDGAFVVKGDGKTCHFTEEVELAIFLRKE